MDKKLFKLCLLIYLVCVLTHLQAQTVTDIEGNIYKTVKLGTQEWMAENLRSTKYNDGTEIPLVTDNQEWIKLTTPAYCWYSNDKATYSNVYGSLYNWYTVQTGKLCPTGWHVPMSFEWEILIRHLGDRNLSGGKLKESGTSYWNSPNKGATNETGFSALPAGSRYRDGVFVFIGRRSEWWIAQDYCNLGNQSRQLEYDDSRLDNINYDDKSLGFSVRCIKD